MNLARLNENSFKKWRDNDTITAFDYLREREMMIVAINDMNDFLQNVVHYHTHPNKEVLDRIIQTGAQVVVDLSDIAMKSEIDGGGDMYRSTYDSNRNGQVDKADDADSLGGIPANEYQVKEVGISFEEDGIISAEGLKLGGE